MQWCLSMRADPVARDLADRHYNREKIGTQQFVPPGRCLVLLTDCARAYWVTSWQQHVQHAWPGAWICSAFRSEGAGVASELIRDAVAATRAHFGEPPPQGMVTFINRREVRPIMVRGRETWGWTCKQVGFVEVGVTRERGYLALQLTPDKMPAAARAKQRSLHGLPLFG